MIEPKSFVRKLVQSLPREPRKESTGKWGMGQGVVWLRCPEMWCPYCEVSWVNPWMWLVNEKRGRLEGVWGMNGERIWPSDAHPHVMSGGEICVGNGTVIEAITSGFNIRSCFNADKFVEIMEKLGHTECRQQDRIEEEEEDDRPYCGWCEERYDEGEMEWYESAGEYFCYACWRNQSVRCDNCHGRFYCPDNGMVDYPLTEVRGGDTICEGCLENYTYCDGCEEYVYDGDIRQQSAYEDPICERCWRDARSECQECGRLEFKEDVLDGICQRCHERIEAEEAAMADDGSEQLELPLTAEEVEDGTED